MEQVTRQDLIDYISSAMERSNTRGDFLSDLINIAAEFDKNSLAYAMLIMYIRGVQDSAEFPKR